MSITYDDIKRLRALCEAATPGPCHIERGDPPRCTSHDELCDWDRGDWRCGHSVMYFNPKRDRPLLDAARTALPALLDEVERRGKLLHRAILALPPRPLCRDCADHDGTCQSEGKEPCDPQEALPVRIAALRRRVDSVSSNWADCAKERDALRADVERLQAQVLDLDARYCRLRERHVDCCPDWKIARQHHVDCPLMARDRVERAADARAEVERLKVQLVTDEAIIRQAEKDIADLRTNVSAMAVREACATELLAWCIGTVEAALTSEDLNDDEEDTLDGLDYYEKICKFVGAEPNPEILAMRPGVELSRDSYCGKNILHKRRP